MTSVRNRFEQNIEKTEENSEGSCSHVTTKDFQDNERASSMFLHFAYNCSLHGLKNVFKHGRKKPHRVIWLLLLVTCFAAALFQILNRILYFYQWPVSVLMDVNYNDSLLFPTVTICNWNKFRVSAAYKYGLYNLIKNINSAGNESFLNSPKFIDQMNRMNISERDLLQKISHNKEDMIMDCNWSNRKCGPENFTTVFTDQGVCYSFNSGTSSSSKGVLSAVSGTENGLQVTLNVEQYEYMPGDQKSVGMKILFHNAHDVPTVKDLGLASITGTNSFFGLQVVEIKGLPKPRGICQDKKLNLFKEYSLSSCESECVTFALVEKCGCRLSYMPEVNDSIPFCSLKKYATCYIPGRDKFHASRLNCDCTLPCKMLLFDPSISYTIHSENKVNQLMKDPRMENIKNRLINAKEVTDRMDVETFATFRNMLLNLNVSNEAFKMAMQDKLAIAIKNNLDILRYIFKNLEKAYDFKSFLYNYQKYLIEKNFRRPWEAIAERTFDHVTFDFYNYISTLKNMFFTLDDLKNNSENQQLCDLLIRNIEININTKLNMIIKAAANFSQYYQSLISGVGIFRYKYMKVPRAHNFYAIPKRILNSKLNNTSYNHRRRFNQTVSGLKDCLYVFTDMLNSIHNRLNKTRLIEIEERYITLSKRFNSVKSVFETETIKYALDIIESNKNEFAILMDNIRRIINDMNNSLSSLQREREELNLMSSRNVFAVSSGIVRYLTNISITKISLAELINSHNHSFNIVKLQVFMEELRQRSSLLSDHWTKLTESVILLWQHIVQDQDSRVYYEYVNYTTFLIPLENVTAELQYKYADYREKSILTNLFGEKDRDFFKSHGAIKEYVSRFKEKQNINEAFVRENILEAAFFYKQLSYEIITDQVAYGFFSLLCDTGGALGLLLGSSILTIFELVDFAIGFSIQKLLMNVLKKTRIENV
ncbi:uncharacterized protein LOC115209554 [Argonauta hians]